MLTFVIDVVNVSQLADTRSTSHFYPGAIPRATQDMPCPDATRHPWHINCSPSRRSSFPDVTQPQGGVADGVHRRRHGKRGPVLVGPTYEPTTYYVKQGIQQLRPCERPLEDNQSSSHRKRVGSQYENQRLEPEHVGCQTKTKPPYLHAKAFPSLNRKPLPKPASDRQSPSSSPRSALTRIQPPRYSLT